ncbi:MAG: glycosyltransferase involved in cell wall biosynthesis [Candidatus Poriferisodalaceae bacterium]
MRILVVTPSLPLAFGTVDARWLHVVVTELARRGREVVCVSCTEESDERIAQAQTFADERGFRFRHVSLSLHEHPVARKARAFLKPFSEYERVDELTRVLDEEAPLADIVHIEHLFPSWVGAGRERTVTYLHHLEVIDWEQRTDLTNRERLTRWQVERATDAVLSISDRVIGASSRLVERALKVNPKLETGLVPVSIDPDRYEQLSLPDEPVVGLIGSMFWYPSRSAADEALGHLFPVAGAELLGTVDRPEDFFSRINTLLYPPALGSGCKIKVMEAMAYGRAVVSNTEGFEGLSDLPQDLLRPLDDDEALIERTVALLRDPAARAAEAAAGRELIENVFAPEPAVDRLEAAYEQLGLLTPAQEGTP